MSDQSSKWTWDYQAAGRSRVEIGQSDSQVVDEGPSLVFGGAILLRAARHSSNAPSFFVKSLAMTKFGDYRDKHNYLFQQGGDLAEGCRAYRETFSPRRGQFEERCQVYCSNQSLGSENPDSAVGAPAGAKHSFSCAFPAARS